MAFDTNEELAELRKEVEAKGEVFICNWKNRLGLKNSLSLTADEVEHLLGNNTPHVYRFMAHAEGETTALLCEDQVRGKIHIDKSLLDDKVLVKQDGMPTYHLANVIDDHLMNISHVIRGEEWLPSLALHQLIYDAFGWKAPIFAHVPLILKTTGKGKLSKRDGEAFGFPVFPLTWDEKTIGFKESGYLPEALVNYLALLGWNDGGEKEFFSLNELIDAFSLTGITKSGGRFDPDRCTWFNQQYMAQLPAATIVEHLKNELLARGIDADNQKLSAIVQLIHPRLALLTDLWKEASLFFERPQTFEENAVKKHWKEETPELMLRLAELLKLSSFDTAEAIATEVKGWAANNEIRMGALMAPLRLALVGEMKGPDVFAICHVIGAAACVARINLAVTEISV